MRKADLWDDTPEGIPLSEIKMLIMAKKIIKILLAVLFVALIVSNGFMYWKIQELSGDSAEHTKEINRMSKLSGEQGLEDEIVEMDSNVSELKLSVNDLKSSISDNEITFSQNQTKIQENSSNITTMKKDLDDLKSKVSTLESKL